VEEADFDEVFLARRNFEMQVELNKTIEARAGTVVQSEGERRIADWLTAHGIAYRYDAKFRIISRACVCAGAFRRDWRGARRRASARRRCVSIPPG
jgi:hypothetical protein